MTQGERESGRNDSGRTGKWAKRPGPGQCRLRSDAAERGCVCPSLRSSVVLRLVYPSVCLSLYWRIEPIRDHDKLLIVPCHHSQSFTIILSA